jgi:hypothetical protein
MSDCDNGDFSRLEGEALFSLLLLGLFVVSLLYALVRSGTCRPPASLLPRAKHQPTAKKAKKQVTSPRPRKRSSNSSEEDMTSAVPTPSSASSQTSTLSSTLRSQQFFERPAAAERSTNPEIPVVVVNDLEVGLVFERIFYFEHFR